MGLSRRKEKLIRRLQSRRMREREGAVLVEGLRAVRDVLDADADIRFAVVARSLLESGPGGDLRRRIEEAGAPVEEVDDGALAELADTETSQGVLLVCAEPSPGLEDVLSAPGGRFLLLDAVQDPGNAGTLIRAARAFGLEGVVALDGTVDPWNPKTVRASAGQAFAIPVVKAGWEEVRRVMERRELPILVADASGEDVGGHVAPSSWSLAVGNEGSGVRDGVLAAASARLRIPMPGGTESLNAGVAGSILLYALWRRSGR